MRRLRDRTLALLAATVLAAGCSSTPEATTGATTVASTDVSTDVPTDATTDATSSAGSPVSAAPVTDVAGSAVSSSEASDPATSAPDAAAAFPLDQYLSGRRTSGASFDAAAYERETRLHEEAIARCMSDEGFEYVPYVQPVSWSTTTDDGVAVIGVGTSQRPDLPPDQFAAQYGYGLSTLPPAVGGAADVNPNAAIVDAMSLAERVAYYQSLFGADQQLDSGGRPNAEMPGNPDSCYEQASAEVWGDQSVPAEDPVSIAFASLLQQVDALAAQEMADPRMVAANETWSICMAGAGFPGYTDLNQPQSDVASRTRTLLGDSLDVAGADPAALAELQQFEISIASADYRCREGYGETFDEVRRDIETRFVEQHLTELEQYRDAVAAAADG